MSTVETLSPGMPVAQLAAEDRQEFITRVYMHVAGAILAFTGIEMFLFSAGYAEPMARAMLGTNWLFVLGAFMIVGWLASRTAHMSMSQGAQYAAFAGFIVAEAIIFVPMLFMAQAYAPGVIQSAATITLMGSAGLTAVAFVTGKDFSFLRGILVWGGILAIVAIFSAVIFGFEMGTWFSVAMIGFAGAAVLYDTSNVIHHYPKDRYVAAGMELFASIALMFWYVLRLLMSRR